MAATLIVTVLLATIALMNIMTYGALLATVPLDNGEPLLLTPLINGNQVARARSLSRVHAKQLGMELESYSGFLTVRPPNAAHLFFWFFPALKNPETAPVILWMNGGPGLTSLSGLFAEIGPYYVTDDGLVKRRTVTWISKFNVIFLDVPVGAGFSFPKSAQSYSTTNEDIARDVQEALRQFFLIFTEYAELDFYVAGESYGGKYAVGLAHAVQTRTMSPSINLKGIIIVSGLYDPVNVVQPSDYVYQTGLIQNATHTMLLAALGQFTALVNAGQYVQASQVLAAVSGIGQTAYQPSFFKDEAGIAGSNNILRDVPLPQYNTFIAFVNDSRPVRRALHVGDTTLFLEISNDALAALVASGDFANTTRPQLEASLNAGVVRTLFVTGNMDYLIVPVGATRAAEALQWKCGDEFVNVANRSVWRVNQDDVNSAGYVKCACNFCQALVRNAGHRLPGDEPVRALALIDRFINNKPF